MKDIKKNSLFILLLLVSAFFLSGCQTTITVHNAKKADIIPIFKDYVGIQGYTIKYQNDKTGSYNVDMGQVFVAGNTSAVKNSSMIMVPANTTSGQPMTAYEQSTWNSVSNPAHYENANAAVTISQKDNDVIVFIDENNAGGTSLDDMKDYLKSHGYRLD